MVSYPVMMKTLFSFVVTAAAVLPLSAAPLPAKADLLASNTVAAQYLGERRLPCMGRTALCPNRCGHAASVAVFRVISNEAYAKPGKYGDDKAEPGSEILIDAKADVPGQDAAVLETLSTLTPGDKVKLTQKHYYADFGDVLMPVRPVTELTLTEKAQKPLPPLPPDPYPVMPIAR